jgi:UDP-N-acetylmuramate-alanine ligase
MESFYGFFTGMSGGKTLVLRAKQKIVDFVNKYGIDKTHRISWFGKNEDLSLINSGEKYEIRGHILDATGNHFNIKGGEDLTAFDVPAFPGYMAYNATGAIVAAMKLGLQPEKIKENIKTFTGMERRFDVYKTPNNGVIITDYGHSPESINHIIGEMRNAFPGRKVHLVFQPHLFSRTLNFFGDFVSALNKSDRISLIDIYPAREKAKDWENKVSSFMLYERLKNTHNDVFYAGKSCDIFRNVFNRIDEKDATCFIGAGDMNLYYGKILEELRASN